MNAFPQWIEWLLFGLAVVSVLLPAAGIRLGAPFLLLAGRWVRWFLFAGLFAFFVHAFEWSTRPAWVHFVTGLALWFLLETGYNWLAIKALSRSDLPLFPDFRDNTEGDEWPAEKRFIAIREWLRSHGYTRASALKARLFDTVSLRASVYENRDERTRLQLLFIPKRNGGATVSFAFNCRADDGSRLITDNLFLPFGGYYPENWNICRKPLVGSLARLHRIHRRRLRREGFEPGPFEDEPLEEINEQQRLLERLNIESGFLLPRAEQEENGKISTEGRYRLWKEMWTLAYFGRSVV
jgi:hypothetical protein